jgi:hypothetical protein
MKSKGPPASRFIAAFATAIGGLVTLDAGFVVAENLKTLTGAQIRAAFTGKQLTDEVHYRFVYDGDGTLRTYSMGAKQVEKWRIQKDEICLYIKDMEDGCYLVTQSGKRFELKSTGSAVRSTAYWSPHITAMGTSDDDDNGECRARKHERAGALFPTTGLSRLRRASRPGRPDGARARQRQEMAYQGADARDHRHLPIASRSARDPGRDIHRLSALRLLGGVGRRLVLDPAELRHRRVAWRSSCI